MKAAFYILIIAFVQSTYGQLDQYIQPIADQETSVYDSLPPTIDSYMPDFLADVDMMFDSVMESSLQTADFDLICYLNGQQKYEPWYTGMSQSCMADKAYVMANLTYWHERFVATLPTLDALFLDAKSVISSRPECGPTDLETYAASVGQAVSFPVYSFSQLTYVISNNYQIGAENILYAFINDLQMIFSYAQSDPTYDAVGALEDAEFRHLTIDSKTIIDACSYSRWWYVGQIYAYYTTVIDSTRHILEDAIIRGAPAFECTGQ